MRAAARGELKLRFKSLFVILVNRIRREEWNDSHFSVQYEASDLPSKILA